MLWGIVLTHAGGSMRVSSSRAATAAALLAGLGVLVVAGRLLPTAPSTRHPTTAATGATSAPAIRTAPGNTRGYAVPNVLGRTLAQAESLMRAAGLQGAANDRDPQGPTAVVVAQEPPAGVLVPPGSVIGFRTRTDVQPNDTPRRLRLPGGPTTAAYRVVAPDPTQHQLTVVVAVPRAAEVAVWLEIGPSQRLPVLDSTRDTTTCQSTRGQLRCVVQFGALEAEAPGVWTVSVAKQSALPAAITVTVRFTPL
jgi:PASTA domain